MSLKIKYQEFYKRLVTRELQRLKNPVVSRPEQINLPKGAMIHYIPDTEQELGIDKSHSLMRNTGSKTLIYHVQQLVMRFGKVTAISLNADKLTRRYHKRNLTIQKVRNFEKSVRNDNLLMVVNYSLLGKLHKYVNNQMLVYQEWINVRFTMWDLIRRDESEKHHFIRFRMPAFLPSKTEFRKHAETFTKPGFVNFHTNESLDLLELWRIVSEDVPSINGGIHMDISERITLVFVESGNVVFIRLQDLINWSERDPTLTPNMLYAFWEHMMSLRVVLEIDDNDVTLIGDDVDTLAQVGDNVLRLRINESMEAGNLTRAEQKGLLKLSEKYKTLPNPITGKDTIEQMVVAPSDLELNKTVLMSDSITIHDKSIMRSSITDKSRLYVTKVMDNDIMQTAMMFRNAGILVKDVSTKEVLDAANHLREYSISLKPINGKPSIVKFKVPIVRPDGTFTSNGNRMLLDQQRSDVPILKTKPHMVALTSYYGKLFVVRNQNNATNWSKWIRKQLLKRFTDETDPSITNLKYGLSPSVVERLPRPYSAIATTISEFATPQYTFYWNYNAIVDNFSDKEIKLLELKDLVPCGKNKTHVLGMDLLGAIYKVDSKTSELLGGITGLIDDTLSNGPIEYTEVSIYSKRLPLVIMLSYIHGLESLLKRLKIPYNTIPVGARFVSKPNVYRIKFKDLSYLVDISNPEHSLLIGGFNAFRKVTIDFKADTWNTQKVYLSVISKLGMTVSHLKEMRLIYDMYVDPITLGLLKELKEPTTIEGLLLKANNLLTNDHVDVVEDYIIKGYDRISGMIYHEMIVAIRGYRARNNLPNSEVMMNPNAVWLALLQDQSIAISELSNPIHNLKEKESVTFNGAGGRSTRSMVKSTRAFRENDIGVISEASPDSAKVGIRTYLTADPNFTSVRGLVRKYNPETDGATSVISTTALLAPAAQHDD